MPELPEVETVRAGLEPVLRGRRFVRVEQRRKDLRFPLPEHFAERLTGRKVSRLERRAKYILVHLDKAEVLAVHLGMTGRFSVQLPRAPSPRLRGEGGGEGRHQARPQSVSAPHPSPLPTEEWGEGIHLGDFTHEHGHDAKHDHLVFTMSGGAVVTYNDARRFGYMTLIPEADLDQDAFFRGLGVEPLSDGFTPAYLARHSHGRSVALKSFLLSQRVVVGLGNIYVCEVLFRAGLSPFNPAAHLATDKGKPTDQAERLVKAIKVVLLEAIDAGGSTLRDFRQADGNIGRFQNSFQAYKREGKACLKPGCPGIVDRRKTGSQSTFYCPACQR